MQTLNRTTVFPCYAPLDRPVAAALAEFLERGADVEVMLEEGEIRTGEDLISKARDGRTADVVLVLFSRNSMPNRWARAQWEGALVSEPREDGVRIAFARCDAVKSPSVLKPLFELPTLDGMRSVKRWVRDRGASWTPPEEPCEQDYAGYLEDLGIAIADRPGVAGSAGAALAYEFARVFREDFDEIFRLECSGRSPVALAGDLAAQLRLRLESPPDLNLRRIADFCRTRRFLFLLEGGGGQDFIFGGRTSTLLVEGMGPAAPDEIRSIQHALANPGTGGWSSICRQARAGRRLTHDAGRLAECFELMEQWRELAREHDDLGVLDEATREMVWILEQWDQLEDAARLDFRRAVECDQQLPLEFF